ncbi:MAG: amidohydrolase [Leptospiraceae bacterium]|nr:hypothetical protein [Leptospiraceae bacterium]MCP5495073.1 amidohydrolase [Leptospiraceae bacterium]
MNREKRNTKIFYLILLIFLFLPSCLFIHKIGGAFIYKPNELQNNISEGAKKLIQEAYLEIEPKDLMDYHVHIVGLGANDSGAFVNPEMQSWFHPIKRFKFNVYLSASNVVDLQNADKEYVSRLTDLVGSIKNHGKFIILGFDKNYDIEGNVNLEKTEFYAPNDYIYQIYEKYPDYFLPMISINPYRKDAITELEKWAKSGVKFIKWLPNSMGIDASSVWIEPFYQKMKEYNMILLTHTGEEQAVDAEEDQMLGNPLLFRKPLGMGIRVIMAHCASLGKCIDIDGESNKMVNCFDLFLRLMDEKKYNGLLFGDISAQVQFNRLPVPIATILERIDLHPRLVNGSDYPLPAINAILRTKDLVKDGFITEDEREFLNEIYNYNPLLFDFVLKRTLKHPTTKQKLSPSVFMKNPGLE